MSSEQQQRPSLVPSQGMVVTLLAAAQVCCCIVMIVTTAQSLIYESSSRPHERCLLSADVQQTGPCSYSIAVAAVSLAGALALVILSVVEMLMDCVFVAAEMVATRVAGERASLGFRAYECFKFVMGGWITQVVVAGVLLLGIIWWSVGVGVIASSAAAADARGLDGGQARRTLVAAAAVALGTQVALACLRACYVCCFCCCPGRREKQGDARGAAGPGGEVRSAGGSRTQPLLPQSVRMPAYPVAAAPVGP